MLNQPRIDFVGDDYDGYNDPIPDPDPLDTCIMHGTHVAGIIGANSNNVYGMSGVAPEASQYAYRVFGCYGALASAALVVLLLTMRNLVRRDRRQCPPRRNADGLQRWHGSNHDELGRNTWLELQRDQRSCRPDCAAWPSWSFVGPRRRRC